MKRFLVLWAIAGLMLLGCRSFVLAFDWTDLNAELQEQSENDSQKILVLKDKQNRIFRVIYQDESLLKKFSAPMIQYKNVFYSWKNIACKDLTFMVFANLLDVVIIPGQFMHHDRNIAAAIPAGITMTYDPEGNLLRYDFRIISGEQFIRINGNYSTEEELVNKTGFAYDDPNGYLRPVVSGDLGRTVPGGINEKMVQALIYLNDEDWNGRHPTVPLETIHKVVELKKANPESGEIQLWKLAKKEKIMITKRQFELVLILYFNQFN